MGLANDFIERKIDFEEEPMLPSLKQFQIYKGLVG